MREECFDLALAQVDWMSPLVACVMEMQELNDPMAVGLLRRQGVVQGSHLVAKLIQQLLASAPWIRTLIAFNSRTIRRMRRLCRCLRMTLAGDKLLS